MFKCLIFSQISIYLHLTASNYQYTHTYIYIIHITNIDLTN